MDNKWYCYSCGDWNTPDEKDCIFCGEMSIEEYCKIHEAERNMRYSDRVPELLVPPVRRQLASSDRVRVHSNVRSMSKVRPRPMLVDPTVDGE